MIPVVIALAQHLARKEAARVEQEREVLERQVVEQSIVQSMEQFVSPEAVHITTRREGDALHVAINFAIQFRTGVTA